MTKYLLLTLAIVSMHAGAETRWRDAKTKTRFMLIDGTSNWFEASRACRERGWDLLNYEYLSVEEQERFRESEALRGLHWQKKLVGQPGERDEASVWMSSEFGAIVTVGSSDSAASALSLQQFSDEKIRRVRVSWSGKTREPRNTVCMYQSHTWEGCSHEIACTYERPDGGTYKIRYSMYEYGPSRAATMARFRERVKNFDGGTGGRCELGIRDPYCLNYR